MTSLSGHSRWYRGGRLISPFLRILELELREADSLGVISPKDIKLELTSWEAMIIYYE